MSLGSIPTLAFPASTGQPWEKHWQTKRGKMLLPRFAVSSEVSRGWLQPQWGPSHLGKVLGPVSPEQGGPFSHLKS